VEEGEVGEAAGDHHGFRTGQVYKPGPDLHKASQPSERKEWQSDRIPLSPHQANIKTFPSPPITERIDDYIEKRVFENFRESRFKMSKPGFWVFSPPSGKGVNTRTDNLRVHTTYSDTRTTSVWITALSHNIVFIYGDINALGWDPRMLFWEIFELWRPNRTFGVTEVA
jgi:hypothetical protein